MVEETAFAATIPYEREQQWDIVFCTNDTTLTRDI